MPLPRGGSSSLPASRSARMRPTPPTLPHLVAPAWPFRPRSPSGVQGARAQLRFDSRWLIHFAWQAIHYVVGDDRSVRRPLSWGKGRAFNPRCFGGGDPLRCQPFHSKMQLFWQLHEKPGNGGLFELDVRQPLFSFAKKKGGENMKLRWCV